MSEPKGVTPLEAVAQCLEGLRQLESAPAAAKVRAADRVVAAAEPARAMLGTMIVLARNSGCDVALAEEVYSAITKSLADFDRAGGGA